MTTNENLSGPSKARVKAGLKRYAELEMKRPTEDRIYEASINALIPDAITEADESFPGKIRNVAENDPEAKVARSLSWSKAYHQAMNRLAREAGLRAI